MTELYYDQVHAFIDNYSQCAKRPLSAFVYTVSIAVAEAMKARKIRLYVTSRLLGCVLIHLASETKRMVEPWEKIYWSSDGIYTPMKICSFPQGPGPDELIGLIPSIRSHVSRLDLSILVAHEPFARDQTDVDVELIEYDDLHRTIHIDGLPVVYATPRLLWKRFKSIMSQDDPGPIRLFTYPITTSNESILLDIRQPNVNTKRRTKSFDPTILLNKTANQ